MLGQFPCAAPVHCMRVPAASLQVLLGGHLLLAKALWNMLSRAAARAQPAKAEALPAAAEPGEAAQDHGL